jgi:hypothetical protein
LDEASGTRLDELNGCGGAGCDLSVNGPVSSAAGKISNAASYPANNNSAWLSRIDSTTLSSGNTDFTLAGWVYMSDKSSDHTAISKYTNSGNQREYRLSYNLATDRVRFYVSPTGGNTVISVTANTFGSPAINTWYFITVWHNASANQICIAVNGGSADCGAHSSGVFDSTSDFRIGMASGAYFWPGRVDEVGFWRRVLTPAERTALYNAGSGCSYPFASCSPYSSAMK